MAGKRVPLTQTISTRDSTLKKDALLVNCYPEKEADGRSYAVRRFGITEYTSYTAGIGLGLFNFNDQALSVIASTIRLNTTVLTTTADAGSDYQFTPTVSEIGFFIKNNLNGYWYDGTTFNKIVDESAGIILYSVAPLVEGSGYTTASVAITGGGGTGGVVTANIVGGAITSYTVVNGGNYATAPTLTVTGDGTGATAIATVSVNNYPAQTVPGVAYLDGYVFVMDLQGRIWNCEINNPLRWNPLSFIQIQSPDAGVRLERHLNLLVAFGGYTTSFFYNAGNTFPASPLLIYESATAKIGNACAQATVVAENTVFWVGQNTQRGRSVYLLNGLVPTVLSDQYVDRVIAADPLTNVASFYIEISGHKFFVLTLVNSNVTLVCDINTQQWHVWSVSVLGSALNGQITTIQGYQLTIQIVNHGLENGDFVKITGIGDTNYVSDAVTTVIDKDTLRYDVTGWIGIGINSSDINRVPVDGGTATALLAGVVTVTPYSQTYFPISYYSFINDVDLLLGKSDGIIYTVGEDYWQDNGSPIYTVMRTPAGDFGTNNRKFFQRAEIIGDKIPEVAYIGYSDNDYQSFSPFRQILLNSSQSQVRRCGFARRRAWEVIYFAQTPPRFYELELDLDLSDQ